MKKTKRISFHFSFPYFIPSSLPLTSSLYDEEEDDDDKEEEKAQKGVKKLFALLSIISCLYFPLSLSL